MSHRPDQLLHDLIRHSAVLPQFTGYPVDHGLSTTNSSFLEKEVGIEAALERVSGSDQLLADLSRSGEIHFTNSWAEI